MLEAFFKTGLGSIGLCMTPFEMDREKNSCACRSEGCHAGGEGVQFSASRNIACGEVAPQLPQKPSRARPIVEVIGLWRSLLDDVLWDIRTALIRLHEIVLRRPMLWAAKGADVVVLIVVVEVAIAEVQPVVAARDQAQEQLQEIIKSLTGPHAKQVNQELTYNLHHILFPRAHCSEDLSQRVFRHVIEEPRADNMNDFFYEIAKRPIFAWPANRRARPLPRILKKLPEGKRALRGYTDILARSFNPPVHCKRTQFRRQSDGDSLG